MKQTRTNLETHSQLFLGRGSRRLAAVLAIVPLLLLIASSAEAKNPFRKKRPFVDGEVIVFSGQVVDKNDQPVPGVLVELEASRRAFSYKRFKREDYNPVLVAERTDQNGEFRLTFKYHHYYNKFVISAVLAVRQAGERVDQQLLSRTDVSKKLKAGSPIPARLTVENSDFLYAFRDFESSVDSADEERVYRENGKPDKVETTDYGTYTETSWWYFKLGSTYMFQDGRLTEVVNFDPIPDPATAD